MREFTRPLTPHAARLRRMRVCLRRMRVCLRRIRVCLRRSQCLRRMHSRMRRKTLLIKLVASLGRALHQLATRKKL
jgi:hypothetical protein